MCVTYNVTGFTASVALSSSAGSTAESTSSTGSTRGGTLRASGRNVTFLAASVTSLGLGGRALNVRTIHHISHLD